MPLFFNPTSTLFSRLSLAIAAMLCIGVLLSIQVDAAERPDTAPRIVNWNYDWSIETEDEVEDLSQWDVVIFDVENAHYSHARMEKIKENNPDIIFLAYISLADIRPDASSLDEGTLRQQIGAQLDANPDWLVYTENGNQAEWWPTYDIMNITDGGTDADGNLFRDYFVSAITDRVISDPLWDGVFYDNLWEGISFVSSKIDLNHDGDAESSANADEQWQDSVRTVLKNTRAAAKQAGRSKFIVTGNGGTAYAQNLNGVGFEHFPNTVYGGWTSSMEEYFFIMRHAVRDPFGLINTNVKNSGDQTDYQDFRFGLTSTLLQDGYYSFDNGDQTHHERWYYDEYNVMLGEPLTGAYNTLNLSDSTTLRDGLWRRDFENATVLVNSTSSTQFIDLQSAYEKIHGTQDTAINSGELIGSVQIPAHDGIILLNRLETIKKATYLNGAFAKVFTQSGSEERSSFFPYDGSFSSGAQIHTLKKFTVVADSTYIKVYDKTNQLITSFAPYGTGYTGGINIDVDKLYGKKNIIVVGTQSAPSQVKIFSLKGKEKKGSGCYPFGTSFSGGVNVAIGNMNKKNKKKEIVVGAGVGGGPQVLILNRQCKPISSGFFAYSSSLRTGVNIAVGDVNGDGKDDIVTAPGVGGGPQVKVFSRKGHMISTPFFAYDSADRSGVWVSTTDIDGDSVDEIVTNSYSIFNQF